LLLEIFKQIFLSDILYSPVLLAGILNYIKEKHYPPTPDHSNIIGLIRLVLLFITVQTSGSADRLTLQHAREENMSLEEKESSQNPIDDE